MAGQPGPWRPQEKAEGRRFFPIVLTVVADFILSAIANAIKLPTQLYVLLTLALIAVALKMLAEYINDLPKNLSNRTPAPTGVGNRGVVQGRLINIRFSPIAVVGALCLFAALCFYYFSLLFYVSSDNSQSFGQAQTSIAPLFSTICAAIAMTLTIAGLFMTISVRALMVFSADGIFIRDTHGRFYIRWNEITNMHTSAPGWGAAWLVAEFPPYSPLRLQRQWILDRDQRTFRICNLSSCGIRRHSVDAALDIWSPFKQARYSG